MPDMENLTQAEYARHRGVKPPHINRLVKAGKIPVNENGRINAADADFALDGSAERPRVSESASGSAFGESHSSRLTQAKTGTEVYRARLAQLEYEERVGKLVPISDVQRSMERCAEIIVRDLERLPALAEDLTVIAKRQGAKALRLALKKAADDIRRQVAEHMRIEKEADEGETE